MLVANEGVGADVPARSLLDAGVVDEITLLGCPASRGRGRRIFEDRQDLKLFKAAAFENGVVIPRYGIKE